MGDGGRECSCTEGAKSLPRGGASPEKGKRSWLVSFQGMPVASACCERACGGGGGRHGTYGLDDDTS